MVVYDTGTEPQAEADYDALRKLRREIRSKLPHSNEPVVYGEALAPCPHCEVGYDIEFPPEPKKGKPPPVVAWPSGFWQGREPKDLAPARSPVEASLPPAENAKRMRELMARFETKQAEYFDEREGRMRKARAQAMGVEESDTPLAELLRDPEFKVDETYFESAPSKPLF